ncbi:hypothetical protein GCM10009624_31430 [Gordonia sinesedis]
MNAVVAVLRVIAGIVVGVLLYALCIDMFGGYPEYHTAELTRVAVGLLVVVGIGIWIWHSKVGDSEPPDGDQPVDDRPVGHGQIGDDQIGDEPHADRSVTTADDNRKHRSRPST